MQQNIFGNKRGKLEAFGEFLSRFARNKAAVAGCIILLVFILFAAFPDLIAPFGFDDQDYSSQWQSPSMQHLCGTDQFGRDVFSRIVYGSRISLYIGAASVAISCVCGTLLGVVSGFYGGRTDNILMRLVDIVLAIPNIMLGMSIVAALGISRTNLILAIGISGIGGFARIVRGTVLSVREQDFIEVARAIGADDKRIMWRHIIPNSMAPIIVQISISIGGAIIAAAGLSFIGLGIAPPSPEWGAMLSAGRQYFRDHWYVVTFPGIAVMLTVFGFNLCGDGLRDALDPRLKN